jgi:hypothetical protein
VPPTLHQSEVVLGFVDLILGSELAAKPVFSGGGRRGLCGRQMFLFWSGDRGCRDTGLQMGGSGEEAWGTVSRINADGVSHMQLCWQTI